ncbi:MAG: bifunctional diaminohydroxyphosphoribosylaminopyrimidine deaminase/5-amino-6-(5-phosphoribosylamino)uracil reductase RibD [Gammaproteobacteria bacterium]|nr:bifunctional diaminohydroxyphosphoribosylaminopyrimidine deaminase/5-amino-6-(5-phosphoribosylamino)uracil reductase RibD [Gammaproteobacteria bacterium]
MTQPLNHQYWMAQALRLARNGLYSTHPNPRVGCVVINDEKLVAQGWHEFAGGPHAEIRAIQSARVPAGSDFYVTLEPCSHQGRTPPCVDELIKLRPRRVIIAMQDPNPVVAGAGVASLEAAGIEVVQGVLETESRALNPGFILRMESGRPFVRLKMAISLDGRTALKNGTSLWISGEAARKDVQLLRARCSAILTSASTVIEDDPSLNLRLTKRDLGQVIEVRHPVRVIVDAQLRLCGREKIFQTSGEIWIYTLNSKPMDIERLLAAGARVEVLKDDADGHINLPALMCHLAQREINEIHTECGQNLAGALLQERLVDEMIIYMAPKLMGSQSRGAFDLGEITHMSDSVHCSIEQMRKIGDDMRLTLSLKSEINA